MTARIAPPPTAIADLAEACARFVERALGIRLDGTQDTLPLLDHYLEGVTDGQDRQQDVLALVAPAAGAYFGEVLRIHLGEGTWELDPGAPEDARLLLAGGRLRVAPAQAALEAIAGAAPEGAPPVLEAPKHRDAARAALADFGRVREGDFFKLAVRFDAILQVHARLGGGNAENGAGA